MKHRRFRTLQNRVNRTYALHPDIIQLLETTAERCIRHLRMPVSGMRRHIIEEGIRLASRKYTRMIEDRWDGEDVRLRQQAQEQEEEG